MFRKTAVSIAMLATLAAGESLALGLGSIELKSALNQPLNAEVELLSATNAEMSEMNVEVGSKDAFRKAGIDRPLFLSKFNFNVKRNDAGTPIIHITSRDVVREPFLDFLLEVSWSKGRLLREYTVLVDPPVTIPVAAPIPVAPVVRTTTPTVTTSSAPVVSKRTVAKRTVTTSIAANKARHTGLPPVSKTSGQYGPTQRADTLWKVAERVRPDSDVSIDQTMLGLLRANPKAFQHNNINNLKAGYVLRVPSREEFTSITKKQASREARVQYSEWKQGNYSNRTTVASTSSTTVQSKPSVTLVSADESKAATSGGGKNTEINAINRDLLIASEALATQRRQSEEMSNRLSALEEQIQSMQRLIQLKDNELARLQQNVSSDGLAEQANVISADAEASSAEMSAVPADEVTVTTAEATQGEPVSEAGVSEAAGSSGFVAFLLANPLWIGISGVVLAMLAFVGARRNDDDEPTAKELEEVQLKKAVSKATLLPAGSVGVDIEHEEKPSDPLAEADVYLAYGRFQQAEDLLRAELAKNQKDESLNMKLLEVFLASKHQTAFDEHALVIKSYFEDSESNPMWERVAELGREISPDNVMYSADQAGESIGNFEPMDFSDLDEVEPVAGAPAVDVPVEPIDEVVDLVSDEPVLTDDTPEVIDEADMDFDLGDFAFGVEDELSEAANAEEPEASGDGELGDLDEISTKLDLARAYIDMGDPDGAKSILDEVLEDGNDDQKNEANDILGQIA